MDTNAKTEVNWLSDIMGELTALREWKEKARPFLVNEFRNVNNSFLYAQSRGESFRDLTEIHETLTELLKGK